jgi:hypothetical protein
MASPAPPAATCGLCGDGLAGDPTRSGVVKPSASARRPEPAVPVPLSPGMALFRRIGLVDTELAEIVVAGDMLGGGRRSLDGKRGPVPP